MVIDKNTNRLQRHNYCLLFLCLIHVQLKKKKSVCVDYVTFMSRYLCSSLETIGHRNSLVSRGFRTVLCSFTTFSSSYFTVPCLVRIWHATRTRHAKQKVWSVLACRTKATVTSIVLLIKYARILCYIWRSACRGMHTCLCHHLFVGFPVDGHIYLKFILKWSYWLN